MGRQRPLGPAGSLQLTEVGLSPTATPYWRACGLAQDDGGCTYDGGPQVTRRPVISPTLGVCPALSPLGVFSAAHALVFHEHDGGLPDAALYSSSAGDTLEGLLPQQPCTGRPFGGQFCNSGGAVAAVADMRDCLGAAGPSGSAAAMAVAAGASLSTRPTVDEWQPRGVLEFLRDVGLHGAALRSAACEGPASCWPWRLPQLAVAAVVAADEEGPLALSIQWLPSPQPRPQSLWSLRRKADGPCASPAMEARLGFRIAECRVRATALGHAAIAGALTTGPQPKGRCSYGWRGISWWGRDPILRRQPRCGGPQGQCAAQQGFCGALDAIMASINITSVDGSACFGNSITSSLSSSSSLPLMRFVDVAHAAKMPTILRQQIQSPPPQAPSVAQAAAVDLLTGLPAAQMPCLPYAGAAARTRRGSVEVVLSLLGTGAGPAAARLSRSFRRPGQPTSRPNACTTSGMYDSGVYNSRVSMAVTRDTPVPFVSGGTLRTLWVATSAPITRERNVVLLPPNDEVAPASLCSSQDAESTMFTAMHPVRQQPCCTTTPTTRCAGPLGGPLGEPNSEPDAAKCNMSLVSSVAIAGIGMGPEGPDQVRGGADPSPGFTRRVVNRLRALRPSQQGRRFIGATSLSPSTCCRRDATIGCAGVTTDHATVGPRGSGVDVAEYSRHDCSREGEGGVPDRLIGALQKFRRRLVALKDRAAAAF